jgi:hypothetical protein
MVEVVVCELEPILQESMPQPLRLTFALTTSSESIVDTHSLRHGAGLVTSNAAAIAAAISDVWLTRIGRRCATTRESSRIPPPANLPHCESIRQKVSTMRDHAQFRQNAFMKGPPTSAHPFARSPDAALSGLHVVLENSARDGAPRARPAAASRGGATRFTGWRPRLRGPSSCSEAAL